MTSTNQVTSGQGTSFWTSVLRLMLITSGTPVFMIPNVFINAGYISGSILLLVVLCLYLYTMHMVLWSAQKISKHNGDAEIMYSDLLYEAFKLKRSWGKPWLGSCFRALSTCVLSLTYYSVCIFVYLLAAANICTFCNQWMYCHLTIKDSLLILVVPVLVLCLISKPQYLESVASFGFFCNLICLALVLCYVLMDPSPWLLGEADGSFRKPLFVGIMLINLSVTPAVLLFKNETKDARQFGSTGGVLNVAYILILILYLTYLLICGLKYGNTVPLNSITILPNNHTISQICPLLYAIGFVCIYPHLYCGLLDLISRDIFQEKLRFTSRCLKFSTNAFKICAILVCFSLAYLKPSLLLFLSLGGTLSTSIDSIIYPTLVHLIVYCKLNKINFTFALILIKDLALLAVGLYLAVMGIVDCIWFVNYDE